MKNLNLMFATTLLQLFGTQADLVFAKPGSSLTLRCPYYSSTKPIIWRGPPSLKTISIDSSLNTNIDRIEIVGNNSIGQYNLLINHFQTDDQGLYQCDTVLAAMPVDYDINVIVAVQPMNMSIVNVETSGIIHGIEGLPLQLTCTVEDGNPIPNITWLYGDNILDSNTSLTICHEIIPSQDQHMKYFKCIADNTFYQLSKKVQLVLEFKPQVELFADPSPTVEEGQSVKLLCRNHTEIFKRNITWKFNGLIIPSEHLQELRIEHVAKDQSGNYSCHAVNRVGVGSGKLQIQVQYKPHALFNKTEYKIEAKIGRPTDIKIFIESFPEPDVAWMGNPGGKLGSWLVTAHNDTVYKICSTVVAEEKDHFGIYNVRVRNTIGSLDVRVNIIGYSITIYPESAVCNMSSDIELSCMVTADDVVEKINTWIHTYNGILVRALNGLVTGNVSMLVISFCDHRDEGNYTCTWTLSSQTYTATSSILVNDRPIKTGQEIIEEDGHVIFKVMFCSVPIHKEILWFVKDKIVAFTNDTILKEIIVRVNNYGDEIDKPGYVATLKVKGMIDMQFKDFSCQIRNMFGILETSFKEQDVVQRVVSNTKELGNDLNSTTSITTVEKYICDNQKDMCATSTQESGDGKDDSVIGNMYILIIAAVLGILVVTMMIIIINQVKMMNKSSSRKVNDQTLNQGNTSVEERMQYTNRQFEEIYEDVVDDYYQDVEWRDYSFDEGTTARLSSVEATVTTNETTKAYEDLQTPLSENTEYSQVDEMS